MPWPASSSVVASQTVESQPASASADSTMPSSFGRSTLIGL